MQFDIKRCAPSDQATRDKVNQFSRKLLFKLTRYIVDINKLRNQVSEFELRYSEIKKSMKFEIILEENQEQLEKINE